MQFFLTHSIHFIRSIPCTVLCDSDDDSPAITATIVSDADVDSDGENNFTI